MENLIKAVRESGGSKANYEELELVVRSIERLDEKLAELNRPPVCGQIRREYEFGAVISVARKLGVYLWIVRGAVRNAVSAQQRRETRRGGSAHGGIDPGHAVRRKIMSGSPASARIETPTQEKANAALRLTLRSRKRENF